MKAIKGFILTLVLGIAMLVGMCGVAYAKPIPVPVSAVGAVIQDYDEHIVSCYHKCESCGYVYSSRQTYGMSSNMSQVHGSFVCRQCHNRQKVTIYIKNQDDGTSSTQQPMQFDTSGQFQDTYDRIFKDKLHIDTEGSWQQPSIYEKDPLPMYIIPSTADTSVNTSNSAGTIGVDINGNSLVMEQAPVLQNGRILVPIRPIAEALDVIVAWNGELQTVTLAGTTDYITLTVGQYSAYSSALNNNLTLDQPPVIINGKVMVPARFIAESFGATVNWDAETREVSILTK